MSLKQKITYSQFKKDKVRWGSLGGAVLDIEKEKSTYKAKPIDNSWCEGYWLERDRIIYRTADEETKKEIFIRYKNNLK
jgi:hypothetical protein